MSADMDLIAEAHGRNADLWYCPVCGYIDPKTLNTHCPKRHKDGIGRPLFRQAVYGYFIRVGLEEAQDIAQRSVREEADRGA